MTVKTFLHENVLFVTIHFTLIPLLAVLTYFSYLPPLALAIGVIALNVLPHYDGLQQRWKTAKHRSRIQKRTANLNAELAAYDEYFQHDLFVLSDYAGDNLVEYIEDSLSPNQRNHLVPLLIYLLEECEFAFENHERTTLKETLRNELHGFSLVDPSTENLQQAWIVYQLLCTHETSSLTMSLPDAEFIQSECFRERFVRPYLQKEKVIAELTSKQKELAEYRMTLSKLYEDGKLNKFGLQQVLADIEVDSAMVLTDQTYFFILINELQHDSSIKEDITDAVEMDGHIIYKGLLGVSGGMYSLLLVVCDEQLSSPEFYAEYIEAAYSVVESDGWLSIHRAKFEGERVFKKKYRTKEPSVNARKGMKTTNVFISGEQSSTVGLQEELIESYLTTDELLSVLPLNLYLPDLPSEKKERLIQNNESIKERFGISHLTDWAHSNHTPEEIGRYLQEAYFPEDSADEWIQHAEQIVIQAGEVSEALS